MYCKIFHINDQNISKNIIQKIQAYQDAHFVTDSIEIKNTLQRNNLNCTSITELFSDTEKTTYDMYESAVTDIEEYEHYFSSVCYNNIPIFRILEPLFREDLILTKKFGYFLEQNKNLVIIFQNKTHSLFLLNKLASEKGYEIDDKTRIHQIKNDKIELISSFKETIPIKKKIFLKINSKSRNDILNSITKKIQIYKNQKQLTVICLTPSTKYVLKPIFSVINEFQKNNSAYCVITFDHAMGNDLKSENFDLLNFSRESLLLSSIIQNSSVGSKLMEKIIKIAQEKKLDAIIFGNSINHKILLMYRLLAILEISNLILTEMNASSSIIAFDGNSVGNTIALVSKKNQIPSFSIRSLYVAPNPILKLFFNADYICVYGTHAKQSLLKLGFPSERIIITGNVMYDYISGIDRLQSRNKINELCNLESKQPLIVIGCGRWYPEDQIWMTKFIKFCNYNKINLIIKVHPIYLTTNSEMHESMIQKIKDGCPNEKYSIELEISPSILLPAADLVITDYTTLGIEANLLGSPWITINFQNDDEQFLSQIFDFTDSIHILRYNDLERSSYEIIKEKKHLEFFTNHQNKLKAKFNDPVKNLAAESVFSTIMQHQKV